jgi:hypothetical protein
VDRDPTSRARSWGVFGVPYLEFDFDVVALDSDFIADDVSRCRRAPYGAARDVEDGPVPRAGHFCAHKHSLREGPASVRLSESLLVKDFDIGRGLAFRVGSFCGKGRDLPVLGHSVGHCHNHFTGFLKGPFVRVRVDAL